jgi:hypothetical protein
MIAQLESGKRQPSGSLLVSISYALQLSEEQEALLFVAYKRLPPAPGRSLASIVALIHLDTNILPEQKATLIAEIVASYRQHQHKL